MNQYLQNLLETTKAKNPAQPEFIQAVEEVLGTLGPVLDKHPEYVEAKIVDRIVEPERVLMFRVPWLDDNQPETEYDLHAYQTFCLGRTCPDLAAQRLCQGR